MWTKNDVEALVQDINSKNDMNVPNLNPGSLKMYSCRKFWAMKAMMTPTARKTSCDCSVYSGIGTCKGAMNHPRGRGRGSIR